MSAPASREPGARTSLAPGSLDGTTVLVTGASRGIGREIALTLAGAGADVAGLARSADRLAELSDRITGRGRRFLPLVADLSDPGALRAAVGQAISWHGRLDGLVNAAGTIVRADPLAISPQQWDEVFAVNVRAPFFLCQEVGRHMLEGSGGAIVNVGSLAAELSTGASVVYSASKAALVRTTTVLAARWAPKVRVNAVGPGYVRTALNDEWFADAHNYRYVVERTPMARLGRAEEVADLVLFLMLPNSGYITGQHILLDGGWSTR